MIKTINILDLDTELNRTEQNRTEQNRTEQNNGKIFQDKRKQWKLDNYSNLLK